MKDIPYIIHPRRNRLLYHVSSGNGLAAKGINAVYTICCQYRYGNDQQNNPQIP